MALRSGRKLSVIRRSGRYDDGEMDASGMPDDEAAVKLAHPGTNAGLRGAPATAAGSFRPASDVVHS
jgi:hypothetical protein